MDISLLGLLVGIFLWWNFLIWVISRIGGWSQLARAYGFEGEFPAYSQGKSLRSQSLLLMGLGSYRSAVEVGWDESALYLRTARFFRVGHKPLRLPWSDLKASSSKKWFEKYVALTSNQVPAVPIHFRLKVAKRLAEKIGENWPKEV
jgi:hypothetical protein